MTALEMRDSLRRGDVSSRELVAQALDAAEAHNDLGAFVELRPELALAGADAADRLIAQRPGAERDALPPLLGLPTAHKDLVRVRGFATTHGSAAVPHLVAHEDDPIAAATRAAGAITIGKTQVPEFGIAGYSENLVAPPARNPFDPERTAGGSSGGTAAAIVSGVLAAAIGSDAGGSIRIPSGACGLVGLKPGRGVVPADLPRDGGSAETDEFGVPRLAVSGPMARTVRDTALYFDAIMGAGGAGNSRDGTGLWPSPALHAVARAGDVSGLRIGVSLASPFASAMPIRFDEPALHALHLAVRALESHGHRIEEAAIDYGDAYPEVFTTVWTQGLRRLPLAPGAEERLGELARWFLLRTREVGEDRIAASIAAMRQFARETAAQWGRYDVVLTPALAFEPPAIGEFWAQGPEGDYRLQCEWAPQTSVVNVAGVPAIAVPVVVPRGGTEQTAAATSSATSSPTAKDTPTQGRRTPRGVQLIGRRGSELQLLQLAEQLTA